MGNAVYSCGTSDTGIARFTWWPRKGSAQWVQYNFDKPESVGETAVYWYDDTPHGGCRPPASWELQYWHDEKWESVHTLDNYGTELHRLNRVAFTPVITTAVRLMARLQSGWSAGILEWEITGNK